MSKWGSSAGRLIGKSKRIEYTMYEDGNVSDIIKVILFADQKGRHFTEKFAKKLKGKNDYRTLENVYDFVKGHIKYIVDIPGFEKIKSPGATWKDKFGDCKSHSVMVGSLLHNLGFDFNYRVAFYDPERPELGHIYCVAKLEGKQVIVDTVNKAFDVEENYWKASDYSPHTGRKVKVSGLPKMGFGFFGIIATGLLYLMFKGKAND